MGVYDAPRLGGWFELVLRGFLLLDRKKAIRVETIAVNRVRRPRVETEALLHARRSFGNIAEI